MSTAKKAEPVPLTLALREAHDWCQSAIFQAARLTELLDSQVAFDHANAMAAEWRALKAANMLPGGGRVEVVESYFLLTTVRHLLGWLAQLGRHGNKPSKEVKAAVKAFKVAVPSAAELKRVLEQGYRIGGRDLPELNLQSPEGGMALKAAKGREYKMASDVGLESTIVALRALAPALAAELAASTA